MKSQVALLSVLVTTVLAADVGGLDFGSITPSRKLEYHPCGDKYQCARLIVPLDWLDDTNNNTVALAIVKLPAKVPEDDPKFGGTLFTNPGGPGGSGVGFILREGHEIQDIVDSNKHYEILSWDPRGVGFTSPKADCYHDVAAWDIAEIQEKAIGPLDASDNALKRQWARTQSYGKLCGESAAIEGSILPFSTTPSVVRDMVEILDRIDELRNQSSQARRLEKDGGEKHLELRAKTDVPRIQYWGFSYGSLLGNTFASMFPGRVGRVIVDGIVDANDYSAGTWLSNLQDTEEIVHYFYKSCFDAGEKCSLKRSSDKAWTDLKQRVDGFMAQTDIEPIPILQGTNISVITGAEILSAFRYPVYAPLPTFKRLADLLSSAMEGNYTLLLEDMASSQPTLHNTCSLPNYTTTALLPQKDAGRSILCGDGEDASRLGLSYFKSYIEELKSQSETLGVFWSTIRFACTGWGIRPKWRFTGPFTTPEHDSSLVEGKPAAPLLFLSSRRDPVTPLRNAVSMAAKHPGAAWVVQESAGHCSISAPSKCTKKIIQDYLEFGTVPESGTSCPADCDPWNPCPEKEKAAGMSLADGPMWPRRFI